MRHRSAMQVLNRLKEHLGEEVNILQICSEIDLSYQPTYYHVRQLEDLGVLATRKEGRQVLCSLRPTPSGCLWLALADQWRQRHEQPSLSDERCAWLAGLARSLWGEQALFILLERAQPPGWGVVGQAQGNEHGLSRLARACAQEDDLPSHWQVWGRPDLERAWTDPGWRQRLRAGCRAVYGRERFWEWMLEAAHRPIPSSEPEAEADLPDEHPPELQFLD